MFKFLFGRSKTEVEVVKETQRETVERALAEVNEVLGGMTVRSKIAVNLETGLIEIELPEQMPDEALALPAPEEAETPAETPTEQATSEEVTSEDTPAETAQDKPAEKAEEKAAA